MKICRKGTHLSGGWEMSDQELTGRLGKMSIMNAAEDIVTQLAGISYAHAIIILQNAESVLEARVKAELVPSKSIWARPEVTG